MVEEKSRGDDSAGLKVEMPAGMQLQGAKLAQINPEGASLSSARLDGADLQQCILIGTNLSGACLRGASASKGDFQAACLEGVDASGALLPEVNFNRANIKGCDFSRTDLARSILTVKDFAGAVFIDANLEAAIFPPGRETEMLGRPVSKTTLSSAWDREQCLKQVFGIARKYALRHGIGPDSDDVASDVVVYLLSNPNELARLNEDKQLGKMARTLAWRRISTISDEDRAPRLSEAVNFQDASSPDDENRLSTEADGYSMDVTGKYEISKDDQELLETESLVQEVDFDSLPSEGPSADILTKDQEERFEGSNLINVLGKVMSEESLRLLIARYVDGQSVDEIAEERDVSELQVVRLLNSARDLARRTLGSLS